MHIRICMRRETKTHMNYLILLFLINGHISVIHHLSADTGCSLEDLPGAMDGRDGWRTRERERERERELGKSVLSE